MIALSVLANALQRPWQSAGVVFGIVFSTILSGAGASAQDVPASLVTRDLTILSPSSGTVVNPGETFAITVSVRGPRRFAEVFVIGEDMGSTVATSRPPFVFALRAPDNSLGKRKLTAVGVTRPGAGVFSESVAIDVEPAGTPTSLTCNISRLDFAYAGESFPLVVMGSFFDNAQADTMVTNLDVTTSSRTTYSTSNPAVALVDDVGRIIAAGPGATTVRIQYGSIGATVPITVKDSPFGDLNGDGKVDQDDLNILQFAIGLVAVGPRDARDRNRNGVIDALDAQDLARTCANSGCRLSFAPFSLFHIERARMKRNNDRAGDDQLEIRGDFRVSRTRDGIDVLKDGVTLMLGSLRRVFSGTSFVRHADDEGRFRVKDPSNGNWRIRIGDDGKFRVEAEKLDLRSINFGQPVLFSLQVGNDLGATEVQFEMKEINHAGRD